ncbi:DUF1642 domain-containing protein [Enterococcus faecium]|uniref:DUF1642 domain-containing protein n=1 Tax=Enterococcus faecium TaxID=1352 RepID=UPI001024B949|nr:DUF1642 domain-containing protein [Enterococcus faecium]VFA70425.1 phage protein, putative [Enterococcus faecium]
MNKQELIDELAKYVKSYENAMDEHGQGRYGAYEVSLKLVKRLNESKITDEQAWNKVAEAYPESAQSLRNTLDNAVFGKTGEHQKPVVPKFVAEWIEYAKKKGDSLAISFKPWNLYGVEYSKADRWIEDNQETFARAWIDGYEVEKEPLYSVIIAGDYLVKEISCSNEVKLISTAYLPQYLAHHYQLTEKQIKAIDERFWPFAVPVEEE